MKELTIEQKAKAYDEAIRKAKDMLSYKEVRQEDMEYLFPELKESEDERIRRVIYGWIYTRPASFFDNGISKEKVLAWLEKQCKKKSVDDLTQQEAMDIAVAKCFDEQKPVDKVEPKFKVGDFIVSDYCIGKVIALTDDAYLLDTEQGIPFSCEHNAHLWTIQDAKDGDVLAFKNNIGGIIIVKSSTSYDTKSYCRLISDNFINKEESGWDSTLLVPATKEQHDALFKAMADAGYTFDFKKKELEKIEQKPQRIISAEAKEALYDKSAWNEKDTFMYNRIKKSLD